MHQKVEGEDTIYAHLPVRNCNAFISESEHPPQGSNGAGAPPFLQTEKFYCNRKEHVHCISGGRHGCVEGNGVCFLRYYEIIVLF